jgi:hypothetical protein
LQSIKSPSRFRVLEKPNYLLERVYTILALPSPLSGKAIPALKSLVI